MMRFVSALHTRHLAASRVFMEVRARRERYVVSRARVTIPSHW